MIETKKSQRPTIVLNGEVDSDNLLDNIPEGFDGDVIIDGCLNLFGDVKANASILVVGNILDFCRNSCIEVVGDLICTGDNWCSGNIIVHGVCYCGGDISAADGIKAEDLECDGIVSVKENITAVNITVKGFINSGDIEVGGDFTCSGDIDSGDIKVGGDMLCGDDIDSYKIIVKGDVLYEGHVDTNGETITIEGEDIS